MDMKQDYMRKIFVISGSIVLTLILLSAIAFIRAGTWLIVADPLPGKVDVVFTFAGESARVNYSKEVMSRISSAHWVLSDYKNGHARILRNEGFDMDRVSVIDTCTSTYAEVSALSRWINDNKQKDGNKDLSVALVSSPYHMRRIKFMVGRIFHNSALHFYYIPVPLDRYNWNKKMFGTWWRSKPLRGIVKMEIEKIIYFWFLS